MNVAIPQIESESLYMYCLVNQDIVPIHINSFS